MHFIFIGLLLGLGAAIPVGPVNLEIARRNLQLGFWYGTCTGLGAILADVVFLSILSFSVIQLLQHKEVLYCMNILGSCILGWFGYQALTMENNTANPETLLRRPLSYYCFAGFSLTIVNPYSVIFWVSVSAQIASIANAQHSAILFAGIGVLLGTASWVFFLNTILHWSKKYLPGNMSQLLNKIGGIILLGFASFGLWKAVYF